MGPPTKDYVRYYEALYMLRYCKLEVVQLEAGFELIYVARCEGLS